MWRWAKLQEIDTVHVDKTKYYSITHAEISEKTDRDCLSGISIGQIS